MSAQFDLEQQILDAWKIVDDLDLYYHNIDSLDQDQSMNIILGLTELYRLKFEKLFSTFEKHLTEVYAEKKRLTAQLRQQDRDFDTPEATDPFSVVDSLIKNSSEPLF